MDVMNLTLDFLPAPWLSLLPIIWRLHAAFIHRSVPINVIRERVGLLSEQITAAGIKVQTLEDELEVVLRCRDLIHKQRTKLSQGRLKDLSINEALEGTNEIDSYLALAKKNNDLDDVIKTLKEKCALARSEWEDFRIQVRPLLWSESVHRIFHLHTSRYADDTADGAGRVLTDKEAVAERIVEAENRATNVGAVVSAFGAGITYTTIFSATRGRLDLIFWAFTCFIVVIMNCAVVQVSAPPRRVQIANFFRSWDRPTMSEFWANRFTAYIAVALPMLARFSLLALSVALLDVTSQNPVPGSQIAIHVAGYLPVGVLGFLGLLIVIDKAARVASLFLHVLATYGERLPELRREQHPEAQPEA